MLAAERRAAILAGLAGRSSVRVGELAVRLGVSEMTIRRDIDALDATGTLRKVHGGAVRAITATAAEPGFAAKAEIEKDSKRAIATAAARFLEPGMVISVTGGTTTAALAEHLADVERLSVLTNSLPLASRLHAVKAAGRAPELRVLLTGGERTPSEALAGPLSTTSVRALNVDLCFMGVHGIDPAAGITTPNLAEAEVNGAFQDHAATLLVLADHTKFSVVSLATISGIDRIDTLITSTTPTDPRYAEQTAIINAMQGDP